MLLLGTIKLCQVWIISIIRRLESSNIVFSDSMSTWEISERIPCERSFFCSEYKNVCHGAWKTSISVRERVNRNKSMMESDSYFVDRKCSILHPVLHSIQGFAEFQSNFWPGTTYIFVTLSKFSCPSPCIPEHFFMKFSTELLCE